MDIWEGIHEGNKVRLEVECGNFKDMGKGFCEPCLDPEPIPNRCYRPMTEGEVKMCLKPGPLQSKSIDEFIAKVQKGDVTYKGQRVRIGKEG